jgi:hypothetical protein
MTLIMTVIRSVIKAANTRSAELKAGRTEEARMPDPALLGTERVGQLTGTTGRPDWTLLTDPQGWPLLQDTGTWGVLGVDLGANTEFEHPETGKRLYFFFGDVATKDNGSNPRNSDLVAWTDDTQILRRGGHLAMGLDFAIPLKPTGVQGQDAWNFCTKCNGMFFNGYSTKGVCPGPGPGDGHQAAGFDFVLPFQPTAVQGQPSWRFCQNCFCLFFKDEHSSFRGVCPMTGQGHSDAGFVFVLPFVPDPSIGGGPEGQRSWRYCAKCAGLFFDGYSQKGVCAGAMGGGFRLHPVLKENGDFDPFVAQDPVGETLSFETPNGAFSHNCKVYVFAGFPDPYWRVPGEVPRPGDPAAGTYLVSKARPWEPSNPKSLAVPPVPAGAYTREFLFSPRIGCCPTRGQRSKLECHEVLGLKFSLPHDIPEGGGVQANWRLCNKCGSLYWGGDSGRCFQGGGHQPSATGVDYSLAHNVAEDRGNQANWRRCVNCSMLAWNGDGVGSSACPAGGAHVLPPDGFNFGIPNDYAEDANNQSFWRFCGKCFGLFWDGLNLGVSVCPKDGQKHSSVGLTFVLQHDGAPDQQSQGDWRFCRKCGGMFWDGDANFKGACPGGTQAEPGHASAGFNFVLLHDVPGAPRTQRAWRFCAKCAGLYFDGYSPNTGACRGAGGGGHAPAGFEFVLPHNPGGELDGGWRFCVKCFGMAKMVPETHFSWIGAVVVDRADHPELPPGPFLSGVVMFGFGYASDPDPGIRLAWMPLDPNGAPSVQDVRYWAGGGVWSNDERQAAVLLRHTNHYSHVSAAWLRDARRWIVLYGTATDETRADPDYRLPAMARIGTSLFPVESWSPEIPIFDPTTMGAYGPGGYMHDPNTTDGFNPKVPPPQPPGENHPGWAYGVFVLNRFTEWDPAIRELGIYYLMSTSSPYQVHLMHSRLRIA